MLITSTMLSVFVYSSCFLVATLSHNNCYNSQFIVVKFHVISWLCVVAGRQYYKWAKKDNIRQQQIIALSECVDECAKRLCEAVKWQTDTQSVCNHPLQSLLQLSHDDQSRTLLSVTSDELFIAYEALDDGDCAAAVCTPLMKRVHRLVPQAADVVVVDTRQPADKHRRCRVIILATSSSTGGLPLGVIATTGTSDASLRRAVELYASLLDSRCFYGRGLQGPTLLLVDDCAVLREALCSVFTSSACLLCTFRLLVSFWRELWDRRSAVSTEQRPHCFALFRAAVLADTVDQLHARFADVQGDCAMASCATHVMTVYERRAEWSVCCQKSDWSASMCVRTVGANRGLCRYASRALKDSVLDYIKSMKTLETLLTFVSRRCDSYYERRLTDTVTVQLDDASALRFMHDCQVNALVVCTLPPSHFDVTLQPSTGVSNASVAGDSGVTCHVEVSVGLCSCSVGCAGGPCVHQWAAILNTRALLWFMSPLSSRAAERLVAHIATGLGYAEASWFASLHPLQRCCDDVMLSEDKDADSGDRLIVAEETVEALGTTAQAVIHESSDATVNALPATDITDNRHIVINWNGLAYEVSVQEQEALIMQSSDALATTSAVTAPSRDRLRQSLAKIEDAYLSHPDVMETAVSAFCQTVESIEVLEHLNSALLCFGNSFLTSGSAALSWS